MPGPNVYRNHGPALLKGDESRTSGLMGGIPAYFVPAPARDLHFISAESWAVDVNVSNPTHPTLYIHSITTPATDYMDLYHDATNGYVNVASGNLALQIDATTVLTIASTGLSITSGNLTIPDDALLGIGTGNTARLSWDTTDANANALLLQMPAGGAVDVPVLAIGQSIESVDLGLFNGVVDPTIAMFGVGAVTTGPRVRIYKARGTIASPTVVTTGDDLFSIDAYGAVAAGEYVQAARILFEMTGTIGTTRGPGVITFYTATDAAPSVLTAALGISASQDLGIKATGRIYLDGVAGSGNTYIHETSADVVAVVANAQTLLTIRGAITGVASLERFTTGTPGITLNDGATASFRHWSHSGVTVTLAGTTQVTTANYLYNIPGATYAQSGGAVTLDVAATIYLNGPTTGASLTLTDGYGIYIDNNNASSGTFTRMHGIRIATLSRATTNYAITIGTTDADQNLIHVGVTGDPVLSWDESEDAFSIAGFGLSIGGILKQNVTGTSLVVAGGIAFTDVLNAWIDDASHGSGTTTIYIGNAAILTNNAVSFGPGAVSSITVVGGQITAIS